MPLYGALTLPTALYPGDSKKVFDAETPADAAASERVALAVPADGGLYGFSVSYFFDSDPSGFSMDVEVSDVDNDADFYTLDNLTNPTATSSSYSGVVCRFVRLTKNSQTGGGALTAQINR